MVKENSVVSVNQRFHLNTSEVKQRSERSWTFNFNKSEIKQRSKHSQRFHFNSIEVI